jgi:hypothetical protein
MTEEHFNASINTSKIKEMNIGHGIIESTGMYIVPLG